MPIDRDNDEFNAKPDIEEIRRAELAYVGKMIAEDGAQADVFFGEANPDGDFVYVDASRLLIKPSRCIVQITATGVANNIATQCDYFVFALCSDGALFRIDNRPGAAWEAMPPIPQLEEPTNEKDV
jgi:hypothetical protein